MERELIGLQEAKELKSTIVRFVNSYSEKADAMSMEEWLVIRFKEELPKKSEREIYEISNEITEAICSFDRNRQECETSRRKGRTSEQWLAGKLQEIASGMGVTEYGNYLKEIDNILRMGNELMRQTIYTKNGGISQCPNLDGFIAEQHYVISFNAQAVLENSPYRAEVPLLKPGKTYGKNSFDIVIRELESGRRVHQYQVKFGSNGKKSIKYFEKGKYNNQQFLVPEGQVGEVQKAFPGKTVTDHIGGTKRVKTSSARLTKEEAKRRQIEAQEKGIMSTIGWNDYSTKKLVLHLGKNAVMMGIYTAMFSAAFELAKEAFAEEEFDREKIVETALASGKDSTVKAIVTGALKVVSEKGMFRLLPPGMLSAGVLANIVCVAVEDAKILMKAESGDLKLREAFDCMGVTTVSMLAGLSTMTNGSLLGAVLLGWIPFVGMALGSLVGGMVGYAAGAKVGEKVYSGAKKICEKGKQIVSRELAEEENIEGEIVRESKKEVLWG